MSKKKIQHPPLSQEEINNIRKKALERAKIGLMRVDEEGKILYLDKNAFWSLDLEGIYSSPQEIFGSSFKDFMVLGELQYNQIEQIFDSDTVLGIKQNFKTISGLYKWVEIDSYRVIDSVSGRESIQLILQDITSRKEAETALRDSEEQYRLLIENQGEGTAILDLDGRFLFCNQAGDEIFGVQKGDLVGRNLQDFTSADVFQLFKDQAENSQIGEKETYEHEIKRIDGASRFLMTTATTWLFNEGRIVRLFCIFRDMTEEKFTEEYLKTSLQEKEIMLKEIHHRVKNNLQVISSLLNLQSMYNDDEKSISMFKESRDRVKSMALIHEKLYQSKDFAHIDFADYLKRLVTGLINTYDSKEKPINLYFQVEETYLGIDQAVPCGLIVNEIITNAMKHAFIESGEGEISIGLTIKDDDCIEITIKDNGRGIPEDFDIQKSESLGMKLVATLAEQLQAKLDISNDNGTVFKFSFKIE